MSTEKTLNAYLLRTYGITLAERDAIVKEQEGVCACCYRPLTGECRLEVDHEHFKIQAFRAKGSAMDQVGLHDTGWYAYTKFIRAGVWAKTKVEAIKLAKKASQRASVRGVLCGGRFAGCNRKLGRLDDPIWLGRSQTYLLDPPARRILGPSAK